MIQAEFRIKKSEDFASAIKLGNVYKNPAFTIHCATNTLQHVRIGISASTKLGNAVVRNRIRRQVRVMCKELINFDSNKDVVIIVKKEFLTNDFILNELLLNKLLGKEEGLLK